MTHPNLIERLKQAGAENLCLVWYRGHAFPLIGEKDGEGNYLLRGSPYDDSFAFANEVDFVLPLQAISTLTAEVEELRAALERIRNGLRAYLPDSRVSTPVSFVRLIQIIDATLTKGEGDKP